MRYTRIFAALALTAGLAACSDLTGPSGSVTGRYVLRTINGSSLPYSIGVDQSTGAYVDVVADTLWINSTGDYQETSYYRNDYGNGSTITAQQEYGTWSSNNGAIQFFDQSSGNTSYQGSVSGTTLTEISSGYTQVFQKQ